MPAGQAQPQMHPFIPDLQAVLTAVRRRNHILDLSEVLARFDRVWERLEGLNAAYSDEEIAADIEDARQG